MNKRTQNCSIFQRLYWSREADYGLDVQQIVVQFTAKGGDGGGGNFSTPKYADPT